MYIRYVVCSKEQSLLCGQQTPQYFLENQKKEAQEYAQKNGTQVIDLFKRG